jgi:hypothetical protein
MLRSLILEGKEFGGLMIGVQSVFLIGLQLEALVFSGPLCKVLCFGHHERSTTSL